MDVASEVRGSLLVPAYADGDAPPLSHWPDGRAVMIAVGVFAVLSVAAGWASKGFLEADACTHYLYARFAFDEPHYLTNVWGRPFCTGIYALPAVIGGRMGVRVMSMLLAVATGLLTYSIARKQGLRKPGLALIFLLGQPLVFLHSFSELTELPFAFLMAAGFWAFQRQRWLLFALVAGLMPTSRPEGFGFILIAAAALVLHYRDWWVAGITLLGIAAAVVATPVYRQEAIGLALMAIVAVCIVRRRWWPLVLSAPLAVWSFAGWYQFGGFLRDRWLIRIIAWLPEHWPYAANSLYQPGWLIHFVVLLPVVTAPFVFPAVLIGLWRALREDTEEPPRPAPVRVREVVSGRDHLLRCQWLIALVPLGILLGHSLLYWLGKMASNGELRYMLVVAPFWALLGALGWEWLFQRLNFRFPLQWAGGLAMFPVLVNAGWQVVPLQMADKDWITARQVANWYETAPQRADYPLLVTTHRGMNYYLDVSPSDPKKVVEWKKSVIVPEAPGEPPAGVMLIWDPMYGFYNSDQDLSIDVQTLIKGGWVPVKQFEEKELRPAGTLSELEHKLNKTPAGRWHVFLSPKDKNGKATPLMEEAG